MWPFRSNPLIPPKLYSAAPRSEPMRNKNSIPRTKSQRFSVHSALFCLELLLVGCAIRPTSRLYHRGMQASRGDSQQCGLFSLLRVWRGTPNIARLTYGIYHKHNWYLFCLSTLQILRVCLFEAAFVFMPPPPFRKYWIPWIS